MEGLENLHDSRSPFPVPTAPVNITFLLNHQGQFGSKIERTSIFVHVLWIDDKRTHQLCSAPTSFIERSFRDSGPFLCVQLSSKLCSHYKLVKIPDLYFMAIGRGDGDEDEDVAMEDALESRESMAAE